MTQQTLFDVKEDKEEKFKRTCEELKSDEEQFGEMEIGEEVEEDKYGWEQLKDKKEQGVDYIHIQLFTRTDLGGTKYGVTQSMATEHPLGMLGSCWGGGGETFNPNKLDEIKRYFNDLMKRKKEHLTEVYRKFTKEETEISYDHHNIYYMFRLVPAENYIIVIGNELLRRIRETGFPFDRWYKEYRELPENEATKEHWENALEMLHLYKKGDKICDKLNAFKEVKKGKSRESLTMMMSDDDIEKEFKKLPNELKKIADEIKEREEINGCCSYSKPYWWELKHYGVSNNGKKNK